MLTLALAARPLIPLRKPDVPRRHLKKRRRERRRASAADAPRPPSVLRKQKQRRSQCSQRARQHVFSVALETQTRRICLWFLNVIVVHHSVTPPVEINRKVQGLFLSAFDLKTTTVRNENLPGTFFHESEQRLVEAKAPVCRAASEERRARPEGTHVHARPVCTRLVRQVEGEEH